MEELNFPVTARAHIATVAQMSNVAYRSNRKLTCDKTANEFTDQPINKVYLLNAHHNRYVLPKTYGLILSLGMQIRMEMYFWRIHFFGVLN